jgi:hypothetical protein
VLERGQTFTEYLTIRQASKIFDLKEKRSAYLGDKLNLKKAWKLKHRLGRKKVQVITILYKTSTDKHLVG